MKLRRKKSKSDCWSITDQIISIKDITHNIHPEFSSKFSIANKTYTCLRNMNGINVYILEGNYDKLRKIKLIYDETSDLINLSILKQYTILEKVYPMIANKVVPPAVNIKFVYCCNIMNINIFIEEVFILDQNTELFKELLIYKSTIDKYEF